MDAYRKCEMGGAHQGKLELVTWDSVDSDGEELGWGAGAHHLWVQDLHSAHIMPFGTCSALSPL